MIILGVSRIFQEIMRTKKKFFNRGQIICRLSHALAQSPSTARKAELDYFPQNVNVRVTSRLVKRLDLSELRNFMKIRPP